jgi:hypothetical protein
MLSAGYVRSQNFQDIFMRTEAPKQSNVPDEITQAHRHGSCDFTGVSMPTKLFSAKEPLNRNPISLGQSKNLTPPRHVARSLPGGERRSRNAGQLGCLLLSQFCFFSEVMQPSSVCITPCFWSSTHARSRLMREFGNMRVLSKLRQSRILWLRFSGKCCKNYYVGR